MAVTDDSVELETVFGGFGPVDVLFVLRDLLEDRGYLVPVELGGWVEACLFGQELHHVGGSESDLLWDGFSRLDIEHYREQHPNNSIILKLL